MEGKMEKSLGPDIKERLLKAAVLKVNGRRKNETRSAECAVLVVLLIGYFYHIFTAKKDVKLAGRCASAFMCVHNTIFPTSL